jgi:UDP-N-acetylglucosamine 2-epimerase (non-hydrolysing)
VWLLGGTRADAVKLAPLAAALRRPGHVRPVLVSGGQDRAMFRRSLATFGARPDRDIRLGRRGPNRRERPGDPARMTARMVTVLDRELRRDPPAAVVVRGATPTALHGALAAYGHRIPVVHLEAGLRSHDAAASFPDEGHRKVIGQLAGLHLAPTPAAAANLVLEGVPLDRVVVVGSTAVDAVRSAVEAGESDAIPPGLERVGGALYAGQRLLVVAVHRVDSRGEPLRRVLAAVADLLAAHPDLAAVIPVDLAGRAAAADVLAGQERAVITGPLDHPDLLWVLARGALVVTDSGGIQEEAPEFGVPVLVARPATERMEAVYAGCAVLVGTDREAIVARAGQLLSDARLCGPGRPGTPRRGNPFGDGRAADRAAAAIAGLLGIDVPTPPPWTPVTDEPGLPYPAPRTPTPVNGAPSPRPATGLTPPAHRSVVDPAG